MGAANAASAYRLYAGRIPATSLNVLVYMALVALDKDPEPSFWQGQEELAMRSLGREKPDKAAIKAVERAMTPLFEAGAVTTVRHSSGSRDRKITARYRLWLITPAPPGNRGAVKGLDAESHPPDNGVWTSYPPPGNRPSTPRNPGQHPPETVYPPPGKRGANEYEEYEEKEEQQNLRLDPALNASGTNDGAPKITNGISPTASRDDFEAERMRRADALTAWEREQSAPNPNGAHA